MMHRRNYLIHTNTKHESISLVNYLMYDYYFLLVNIQRFPANLWNVMRWFYLSECDPVSRPHFPEAAPALWLPHSDPWREYSIHHYVIGDVVADCKLRIAL